MDNLEKLYRDSFDNFERKPKIDWERLEPMIPPKGNPSKEKGWLFLGFLVGVLTTLLSIWGYQSFAGDAKNRAVQSFPILFEKEDAESAQFPKDLSRNNKEKGLTALAKPQNNLSSFAKPKVSGQSIKLTTPYLSKDQSIITNDFPKNENENIESKPKADQVAVIDLAAKNTIRPVVDQKISQFLPPKEYNLSSGVMLPELFATKGKFKKKKKKRNRMESPFITAQYTPLALGRLKIDNFTRNNSFSKGANIYQTKGWNLNAGILFEKNWLIQMGLSRHQYKMEAISIHTLITKVSNATETAAGFEQQYLYEEQAIIEPIEARIKTLSTAAVFQDNVPFSLNSRIQQPLTLTGVSSQIGYRFFLSPRWQVIPKIGLSATWAKKGKATLTKLTLIDSGQTLINANLSNTNVTTANFIEGLVTTEFAFQYSRRIFLVGTPQFRTGFNPFFKNFQRSAKHRFGQLQLGIRIHLL